jgi:hypothetical protein
MSAEFHKAFAEREKMQEEAATMAAKLKDMSKKLKNLFNEEDGVSDQAHDKVEREKQGAIDVELVIPSLLLAFTVSPAYSTQTEYHISLLNKMKDTLNYLSEETSFKYHEQLKHLQARCEQLEADGLKKHKELTFEAMVYQLKRIKQFYTYIVRGDVSDFTESQLEQIRREFLEWEKWAPRYADQGNN